MLRSPIDRKMTDRSIRAGSWSSRILGSRRMMRVCVVSLVFLVMISSLFVGSASATSTVSINVNTLTVIKRNKLSLGFMLESGWKTFCDSTVQRQLAKDANFRMVRFFSTRVEPCTYWNESKKTGTFNWANVDLLVRRIFEIGAEPLICIGRIGKSGMSGLPRGMAKNSTTGLAYPASWAAYCAAWVKHFKTLGMPVRFYEIINEPQGYFAPAGWNYINMARLGYFAKLFNTARASMRLQNSAVMVSFDFITYKTVLNYWLKNGYSVDTLNFHKYDDYRYPGPTDAQLFAYAESKFFGPWPLGGYSVMTSQKTYLNTRSQLLPLINSESAMNAAWVNGSDPRLETMVGATWVALVLRMEVLNGVSYNVHYLFNGLGAGFNIVNSATNRPWYPYYVYQMIGKNLAVNDAVVATSSSSADVRTLAWVHGQTLNLLLVCKVGGARTVYLSGLTGRMNMSRIDNAVSWKTPRIQTSTFDATRPLTLNGYTVVLLQMPVHV